MSEHLRLSSYFIAPSCVVNIEVIKVYWQWVTTAVHWRSRRKGAQIRFREKNSRAAPRTSWRAKATVTTRLWTRTRPGRPNRATSQQPRSAPSFYTIVHSASLLPCMRTRWARLCRTLSSFRGNSRREENSDLPSRADRWFLRKSLQVPHTVHLEFFRKIFSRENWNIALHSWVLAVISTQKELAIIFGGKFSKRT